MAPVGVALFVVGACVGLVHGELLGYRTVWIASPVVVVALHLIQRVTRPPFERSPRQTGATGPMG
jgi:uncharacterized membrane protein YoaK (UPF0700 family)